MSYAWKWSGLMAILIMAIVINFFLTAAAALMPILVTRHFGGGARAEGPNGQTELRGASCCWRVCVMYRARPSGVPMTPCWTNPALS